MGVVLSIGQYSKIKQYKKQIRSSMRRRHLILPLIQKMINEVNAKSVLIYGFDPIHNVFRLLLHRGHQAAYCREIVKKLSELSTAKNALVGVINLKDSDALAEIIEEPSDGLLNLFVTRLIMPIHYRRMPLGLIEFVGRPDNRSFGWEDEQLIQEIASILAGILNKADNPLIMRYKLRLYRKVLHSFHIDDTINRRFWPTDKPLENLLMQFYRIPRAWIGAALERCYRLPFTDIHPDYMVSMKTMAGLPIDILKHLGCLPTRNLNGQPLLVVGNPWDVAKIRELRSLYPRKQPVFSVGIQSDIIQYLESIPFNDKQKMVVGPPPPAAGVKDDLKLNLDGILDFLDD